MLLPHLVRDENMRLVEVTTSRALSGANAAHKFSFDRISSDYYALLAAFNFLTGSCPVTVFVQGSRPLAPTPDDLETIAIVVGYDDSSVGNLLYLTQDSAKVPKEFLEVLGDGKTAQLNNFESLTVPKRGPW